jgi:hypothetical protein
LQNPAICIKCFSVDRGDIAYLRFIIESYDNLAILSTIDASNGIVSLTVPGCFVRDAENLIQALKSEITINEITLPEGCSGPWEQPHSQERH